MKSEVRECLPTGLLIDQTEVQNRLSAMQTDGASLGQVLGELERWSESTGYFGHLTQPNEYLEFRDEHCQATLRLQINYSRLSYNPKQIGERFTCPLCFENIGTPGKERLRAFEFEIHGTSFFAHLTPFPLHPGHFVMNTRFHEPMRIGERGLRETAAFLHSAPGWLAASNSDVEWAGASVLGHHHVQLFRRLDLPMESVPRVCLSDRDDISVSRLQWYCPVLIVEGGLEEALRVSSEIIGRWKARDPGKCTCNYLMRLSESQMTCFLFLRHPDFRTPESIRHIKSEGVGIIEMAGEIIVPPIDSLSRNENVEWFRHNGLNVCRQIISGNAPDVQTSPLDRIEGLFMV